MRRFRMFVLCIAGLLMFSIGCGGGGGGNTGVPSNKKGNGGSGKTTISILRPSPCQRVSGALVINVDASNTQGIDTVYVTVGGATVAVFDKPPYAASVACGDLPTDGTYTLSAVVVDKNGVSTSSDIEIRINCGVRKYNLLVVDADADPFKLGGAPGAVFRINTDTGHVCALASSKLFVDPSAIAILGDNTIVVSDRSSDMNGTTEGVGAIFSVAPDKYNVVNLIRADTLFRAPVGIDITADSIFVADYDAGAPSDGPGAIFVVSLINGNTTVFYSNPNLISPVGVTVDPSGDLWVLDSDYDPLSATHGSNHGSIWRYNASTDKNFNFIASSSQTISPFQVKPDGSGNLILSDRGEPSSPGKMFAVDLSVSPASIEVLASGGFFSAPSGFIITGPNTYLIADTAGIIQLNPDKSQVVLYSSPMFVTPMGIVGSAY